MESAIFATSFLFLISTSPIDKIDQMPITINSVIKNLQEDLKLLMAAQQGRLQLKAVEYGVPIAVKSVYFSFIAALVLLFLPLLFVTIALAFGLIFASPGDVYDTVKSFTLGFLCMDGFMIVIITLLLVFIKPWTRSFEAKITNDYLDKIEEKERQAADAERFKNDVRDQESTEYSEVDVDTEIIRVEKDDRMYKPEPTSHE